MSLTAWFYKLRLALNYAELVLGPQHSTRSYEDIGIKLQAIVVTLKTRARLLGVSQELVLPMVGF